MKYRLLIKAVYLKAYGKEMSYKHYQNLISLCRKFCLQKYELKMKQVIKA